MGGSRRCLIFSLRLRLFAPLRESACSGLLMTENEIATQIVDAACRVHTTLGPGLFESVYETVMAHELTRRGFQVARQQPIAVVWENVHMEAGFRADLIVEDKVIVEIKSIEASASLREAVPL